MAMAQEASVRVEPYLPDMGYTNTRSVAEAAWETDPELLILQIDVATTKLSRRRAELQDLLDGQLRLPIPGQLELPARPGRYLDVAR